MTRQAATTREQLERDLCEAERALENLRVTAESMTQFAHDSTFTDLCCKRVDALLALSRIPAKGDVIDPDPDPPPPFEGLGRFPVSRESQDRFDRIDQGKARQKSIDQQQRAYERGLDARMGGKRILDNPYGLASILRQAWSAGWAGSAVWEPIQEAA